MKNKSRIDFIQIGANIGNTDNDPMWPIVREKKWKGIFVEPIEESFKQLKENYSNVDGCFFENIAILDYNGKTMIYTTESDEYHRQQASVNKKHWRSKNKVAFEVPCSTLTQLIEKYDLFNIPFKMLQIDAEGSDERILLNTDFSNIRPEFIRFEHCHMLPTSRRDVILHLKKFGYVTIHDEFQAQHEVGPSIARATLSGIDTLMKREEFLSKRDKDARIAMATKETEKELKMEQSTLYWREREFKSAKLKNNKLFSLGDLYVSDFIKDDNSPRGGKEPLSLIMDNIIGAPKLSSATDPDKMYGKYWYRSGINATMTKELKSIADSCINSVATKPNDLFLDIACNDGTLLKFVPDSMIRMGVDPVDDTYYKESSQNADLIIQDYFTAEVFKKSKFGDKKAKIITTIAMFYDLDNPLLFLEDVNDVLDDEGLFVLQMSYTPLMLRQLAFDNICHEHVYYYSLTSIINLVSQVDMRVVDCELNDINGGSFRVYIRKNKADETGFRTSPYRDVAQYRIESILKQEEALKISTPEPYLEFYKNIVNLKEQTVNFIKKVTSEGKVVWGYGASTKGNTLLQWFGLDSSLISGIAERSPYKFGLKTVGTNIPIYSEDEMRKTNPDYLLILPWHFISEFRKRENDYLQNGGKFIVPCPKFEIIGKENV